MTVFKYHRLMSSIKLSTSTRAVAIGAGLAGASFLLYRAINNYLYWNGEFVPAGTVKSLYVFPVKSCMGNKISEMECTIRGGKSGKNRDRDFVIVDKNTDYMFITGRTYPKTVMLKTEVDDDDVITITDTTKSDALNFIKVSLRDVIDRNEVRKAKLHSNTVTEGLDCGDEVGAFITEALNVNGKRQLRLLYFRENLYSERNLPTSPSYWNNSVPALHDHIAYADLASYLAFTTASVNDLNEHLCRNGEGPISDRNFRPNIVVNNPIPFDEDQWLRVRIGKEVELICYKPCTRCILTTVDPDTGLKHPGMEPLKELRKYRAAPAGKLLDNYKFSPIFGVNLALVKPGTIKVGDEIFVQYKPSPF